LRREFPWIAILVALIFAGAVVVWVKRPQPTEAPDSTSGDGLPLIKPHPKSPSPSGTMVSHDELRPEADPPARAQLMYSAPPLIPVQVKTERKGDQLTINLIAHGELFDFEKYIADSDHFAVALAAGDEYSPPIPILTFPLNVGAGPTEWSGTISNELTPHKATAEIEVSTDNVTVGDAPVRTVRADVTINIEAYSDQPETERHLVFWFQEGKGLIKREFGSASTREPAEE